MRHRTGKERGIRAAQCAISLAMDSIGTVGDAFVGVGPVDEVGRATRSRVSD